MVHLEVVLWTTEAKKQILSKFVMKYFLGKTCLLALAIFAFWKSLKALQSNKHK